VGSSPTSVSDTRACTRSFTASMVAAMATLRCWPSPVPVAPVQRRQDDDGRLQLSVGIGGVVLAVQGKGGPTADLVCRGNCPGSPRPSTGSLRGCGARMEASGAIRSVAGRGARAPSKSVTPGRRSVQSIPCREITRTPPPSLTGPAAKNAMCFSYSSRRSGPSSG
jgi:hypothetical protein